MHFLLLRMTVYTLHCNSNSTEESSMKNLFMEIGGGGLMGKMERNLGGWENSVIWQIYCSFI